MSEQDEKQPILSLLRKRLSQSTSEASDGALTEKASEVSEPEAQSAQKGRFKLPFRSGSRKSDDEGSVPETKRAAKKSGKSKDRAKKKRDVDERRAMKKAREVEIFFTGSGTITIGKKEIAIGLDWEARREDLKIKEQAEEFSLEAREANVYAKTPGQEQIGFGSTDREQKIGTHAGALCAPTDRVGSTWLAAFRVGSGHFFWLAAMRDGLVYEDRMFDNLDALKEVFNALATAPDWEAIICPADWEVEKSEEIPLAAFVDFRRNARLKPTDPVRVYAPRAVFGAVLVLAVGAGGFFYMSHLEQQRIAQEELRAAREAAVRITKEDMPWYNAPSLAHFTEACREKMESALTIIPGWEGNIIECTLENNDRAILKTNWQRSTGGRYSWLRAAVSPKIKGLSLLPAGDGAQLITQVALDGPRAEFSMEAWELHRIQATIAEREMMFGLPSSLSSRIKRYTVTQRQNMRKPAFNNATVTVSFKHALREVPEFYQDIPGLVPSRLTFDPASGQQTLSFDIYLPPIMPLAPRSAS